MNDHVNELHDDNPIKEMETEVELNDWLIFADELDRVIQESPMPLSEDNKILNKLYDAMLLIDEKIVSIEDKMVLG